MPTELRAVVDTNVWVSAVLNPAGAPAAVLEAFVDARFVAVTSAPLLNEVKRVLSRPRLVRRYRIDANSVEELLALLRIRAVIVWPPGLLHLCRDPDDDVVLETAILGSVGAIVTRDDDLKRAPEVSAFLGEYGIPVFTVRQFLTELVNHPG